MATSLIDSLTFGSDIYVVAPPYGVCSTTAATAAKVVTVGNFSLETGAEITVKFSATNTASNPTLNVNGTGAKAIYYKGAAIESDILEANKVYKFSYNGTQYDLIGYADTNTGVISGSYGPSGDLSPAHGSAFNVPSFTVDSKGKVTAAGTHSVTLPAAPTSVSGNAGSATKLANARTIALSGDATGSTTFDGSKNVSIKATLANSGVTADSYGPTADTTANAGDSFVVPQVTVDAKGRVTDVTERTITLPATPGSVGTADKLSAARTIALSGDASGSTSFDGSKNVTINATLANSGVTAGSYGPSTNASPAHGASFSVPQVTVDAKGRVTSAASRTITMPAVSHPTISTTADGTDTAVSPGFGGNFSVVSTVTRDANGHVTQIKTKSVTLPAAPTSVSGNAGTANKLKTARTIALSGGATGSASFDGSANTTINVTSIDGSKITGEIPLSSIPKGAQERLVPVANMTAMLALTSSDVQNGDVVKLEDTGIMYYVADETRLGTEAAFSVFTAGAASSVPWTGVTSKPTFATIATSGSYNDLSNKPTIPSAGTTTPKVAGTASAGSAATYSRSDHVHPVQTSVSGNAGSATKLATARNIALSGDVTGSASFDGSADASISATLANSGVTAGSYGPTANTSPTHGGTFTVPQVTVDAKGRVTSAASRTITMPAVSHPTISTSSDTTSTASPGSAGTFTAVDSVTRDSNGHVTKVNTKTVTMPTSPTLSSLGGASTKLYTATIGTSWSGSAAPYTQNITVSGILASDTPIVDVDLSSTAYANKNAVLEAYAKVYRITTAANSITVYADEKTTTSIPIQLKVIR